jgi:flavin reductase (DIM6/NTAB) family NADH-FMN oxidoreductase RutF
MTSVRDIPATTNSVGVRLVADADFRSIMASFPSGVTVVTTLDAQGRPRGITVSAFISVSAEPPMLAVCLASTSSTLAALKETGSFATHVLAEDAEGIARQFAKPGGGFDYFGWTPSQHAGGVPVLASGAVAVAECSVEAIVPAGDHDLVIGLIHGGRHSGARPLVYHRRQFSGWVDVVEAEFDLMRLAADPLGA